MCGIDFPTGTPGAPHDPVSGAEVRVGAAADPRGAPPRDDRRAGGIAASLQGALDEEFGFAREAVARRGPKPPHEATGDEAQDVPFEEVAPDTTAGSDGRDVEDRPAEEPVKEAAGEPRDGPREPAVGPAPRRRGRRGRDRAADLTVTPALERTAAPGRRGDRPGRDVVPARRRSKAGSLVTTVVLALVLISGLGGAAWWLDVAGIANFGITERLPAPLQRAARPMTVAAEEGWVDVPAASGEVVVTADGPYRIRLDGVVYSFDAGESVRVPMTEETSLSVRTARPPAVASITPVP